MDAEIRTAAGWVRGGWENEIAVFRGIPYAPPPFGARRFQAPAELEGWDGVRAAVAFGSPVPQAGHSGSVMRAAGGVVEDGSDDCLTVNVWSPELGRVGMPVMVWIHGGAYLEGSSGDPHVDGARLAAAGVVVVSIEYRTGFEGFAHIAGAPDNRGILDQIAALHWTRRNIDRFGGDPGNVTVFGQSAGAGCIAALISMPLAAGLFRRAIAQSVPGTFFAPDLAAAISGVITGRLGARVEVEDLASVPPGALVDATQALIAIMPEFAEQWGPMALTPTPFSPVLDHDRLPRAPWQALADGAARGIELLVGHTRDEYRLFVADSDRECTGEQLAETIARLRGVPGDGGYLAAYPDATAARLHEIVNADWLFRMPSLHLAQAQHVGGGRAWMYELCWGYNRDQEASHSLDFLLVFGTLTAADIEAHPSAYRNAVAEAVEVGERMRADWVRFARSGHPGWGEFDARHRCTRVYSAQPYDGAYPEERSRWIWRSHRFKALRVCSAE
ncbi:carboxylesterase family protein [Nocardia sp. NPDC050435]|uniref:carboxylesterase/lipase family protein n=1 Tax=Nocardia sp. NPDC050435 TaxID=3155040 RepID=UPI0033D96E7D